jgi:predicted ribosome quality control (RQC) complex YloA/Tae2 family protein
MHELTSLELGAVVDELRPRLANSFMKKFYDLGNGSFRMSFHGTSGNVEVYCRLLVTINETRFKEEVGEATPFAMAIRKRIEDSKVLDLYQHGSDRIVVFEFAKKDERYRLFVEMFGKGNLILVNSAGKIELCSRLINFRERSVRPGFEYVLPKSDSIELRNLNKEDIERVMETVCGSQNKMIIEISKFINIGPIYLDEVIRGAGLDPRNPLKNSEVGALSDAFVSFFERVKGSKPVAYFEDGKLVDYSLVKLSKYSGLESKEFQSFSEALDEVYVESRRSGVEPEENKDLEELDANIGKQKELVKSFADEAKRSEDAAKTIFENMNEINSVIYYMQQNKRATAEDLKREFPGLRIDKINLKDKKIVIEM